MVLFARTARAWANLPLRAKGLVAALLPAGALLLSVVLIMQVEKQKQQADSWVKHAQDLRIEILNTYILLVSAESAVRDYALTGHEAALQPYDRASASTDVVLERVKDLVQDHPEQVQQLSRLKELIRKHLDALKALRGYYDSPPARGHEAPQELLRQGKTAMDGALFELAKLFTTESKLLKDRTNASKDRQATLDALIAVSLIAGLFGGVLSVWLFTRGIVRRVQQAESNAHRLEQGLPLETVSPGNDELGRLANALERTGVILARQGEELTLALESAQVLIWELDSNSGSIRYQAGSGVLKTAAFPSELLPETMERWLAVVHSEDRAHVRTELNGVLAGGGSFQIEYRVVLGGGEIRWMAVKGQLHSGAAGGSPRLLGVVADVTARRKSAEETVRQAQELNVSKETLQHQTRILRSILDSMADGVVVADQNGQFLVFNPAAQGILGSDSFAGEPNKWPERYGLFLPDMVTLYSADQLPFMRAIRGESVDGAEIFVRPAGVAEGSWLNITARPLREDDGGIRGGVLVMRNVTASKRAAEALGQAKQEAERANQAKSEFLSRMSHELRTPLNSVLGFAQLLELEAMSEQQSDNVQRILKGGRHLLELINEILDLARIEAGRFSISTEPVRVREALKDALDLVQPLAIQRNIHISSNLGSDGNRHVKADRQRLQQILLNLLSNAIKFNRSGGSVILRCKETRSNTLRLEVADTGAGISPDGMQRLFIPFERLGADLTGVEGSGLGLSLTKRLVEAMGGNIGVESTLGLGTKFFIDLEIVDHPADWPDEDLDAALAHAQGEGRSRKGTILYIEDNLSNLQLMERILERSPEVTLLSAMQAYVGLDLAQLHTPDLILLDLHLPDLPGQEVLRRLREDPRTRHIPVTVVSADATPGQIDRLLAAGANAYLTKPLDVKNLLQLIEHTMNPVSIGDRASHYAQRNLAE